MGGDCPVGQCLGTTCSHVPDVTCVAEYDVDLCVDAEVAGVCSANGDCVVSDVPPAYTCPGCNGICIKCLIFQFCFPFF